MRAARLLLAVLVFPAWAFAGSPRVAWSSVSVETASAAPASVDSSAMGPGRALAVGPNGDAYVVASLSAGFNSPACMEVRRHASATGALVWKQSLCGNEATRGRAIAVDSAGNAIVGGGQSIGSNLDDSDFRVVKLAGDGSILWSKTLYASPLQDWAIAVAVDRDDNVIAVGQVLNRSVSVAKVYKLSPSGVLLWENALGTQSEQIGGLAIDAQGDVFVATSFIASFLTPTINADWRITRFAAADGSIRWRQLVDRSPLDIVTGLGIDSAGNAIVAGTRSDGPGSPRRLMLAKLAAADGSVLWDRALDVVDSDPRMVVDDSGGAIVAYTSGLHAITSRYSGTVGGLLWQATFPGAQDSGNSVQDLVLDRSGDVLMTASSGRLLASEMKVVRYAKADGAEVWSLEYAHESAQYTFGIATATGTSAVYALGATGFPDHKLVLVKLDPSAIVPALNAQGLWWSSPAGSQPGWGVNFAHQGNILFATWFTYDGSGVPIWYVMSNGKKGARDTYSGDLYVTHGPSFDSVPFRGSEVRTDLAGYVQFAFTGENDAVFTFRVYRDMPQQESRAITRMLFSSPAAHCVTGGPPGATPNYQDLWWTGGSEAGWGLNLAHQGDTLFATWYTYSFSGTATWYVASNLAKTAQGTYSGKLYRSHAPSFLAIAAGGWRADRLTVIEAGTATLTFSDADHGTFAYTADGVTGSKAITRMSFSAPPARCS